jgi:hypothetical protein
MIQKSEPRAILAYNAEEFEPTVNQLFSNINSFEKGNYTNDKFPSLKHLIFLKDLNNVSTNAWTWSELAYNLLNKGAAYELPSIDPEDDYAILFTARIFFSISV